MSFAAVVLAAGKSQRMGLPKQVMPVDGRPMVRRVVETLLEADVAVHVVTGCWRDEVEAALAGLGVGLHHNERHAAGGMLSSVKVGARVMRDEAVGGAEAFFIVLGDQPLVAASTIRSLISVWVDRRARVVVPVYQGTRGHPVLFAREMADEILALPDDGSLKMLTRGPDAVEVAVSDAGVTQDVDTMAEYQAVVARLNERQ